jgi:rhodanese-related sulfurtransferase
MSIPELDPRSAKPKLAAFRVLDVREPHEFTGPLGSVPGSENVPLSTLPALARAVAAGSEATSPAGKQRLLLVCRSGKRSLRACEILREQGFGDVTNLAGGMIAWNRAGLAIDRPPLPDLDALLRSLAAWLAQVGGSRPDEARGRIDDWLAEIGDPADRPTSAGVLHVLACVEASWPAGSAPDDLDLTVAAFRRDLEAR